MTLRLRVVCGYAVATVIAALAITQIFIGLRATHAADRAVSGRWAPAAVAADELVTHLVDQETGERGYVITGDEAFLRPYTQGRLQTSADLAQIHQLAGGDPSVAAAVTAVEDQWDRWLSEVAEPEIAARRTGAMGTAQLLVDREQGSTVFDLLRAKMSTLEEAVAARVAIERKAETAGISRLERTLIATSIAAVLMALVSLGLLSTWVLRPL
ncbi:MAG: hypothetical protein QOJ62_1467, partial [Actinomycetota bacterium]|nr:hypothetical protein [Actinomycetota bacterium]